MELNYTKHDLKGCILDTYGMPATQSVMEKYPLLKKLSGFEHGFDFYANPKKDKDRTIRYINLYYSKGTKIEEDFPDPYKRKAACAKLAGFDYDHKNGEFDETVAAMLKGEDPMVNRMIVSFCMHHYSTQFTTLMLSRDMYMRMLEDVTDPTKGVRVFEIAEELGKLEMKILNGDNNPNITVSLIQRMEEVRMELKPEDIASRIASGKKPIDFEIYE